MKPTTGRSQSAFRLVAFLVFFLTLSPGRQLPPSFGGLAQAGDTPAKLLWKYEFTGPEEVIQAKKERLQQLSTANASTMEVSIKRSAEINLATVTLKGEGSVAALKKIIFNPEAELTKIIMQPATLRIKGSTLPGKSFTVTVASNFSTGYLWKIEERLGQDFVPIQEEKFEQTSPLVGGAGRQIFFLRAREGGEKQLTLNYQRPWEPQPESRGVLELEVDGDIPAQLDLSDPAADPPPAPDPTPESQNLPPETQLPPASDYLRSVPSTFDWRTGNGLTAIRNQGNCGSCWAFATVGVLEGAIKIASNTDSNLSEQFLVSCNKSGYSCDGGWWAHDYHQSTLANLQNTAGAVLEADFPYTTSNGSCRTIASHPFAISSWHQVGATSQPSVAEIKDAIYNHGPISSAICAGNNFSNYSSGVFATNESNTCQGGINHAVVLVGWNDSEQSWILRNSWGQSWGESGYMRIRWGTSNIGYGSTYIDYENPCSFTLGTTSATIVTAGGTGTVAVTTQGGCARTAVSNVAWITITAGANASGSGNVQYAVAANTGSSRTGTLTIAGQTFTVTQSANSSCTYTLNPSNNVSLSAASSSGTVGVTTQNGCTWSSSSALGWATITSGSSGTGSGTIGYAVTANSTGASRSGTLTIAGKTFTINQAAPISCTYNLNSISNSFPAAGGTGSISVNTQGSCNWTAVSNSSSWATITAGSSGSGSGVVEYTVAANSTSNSRSATITVGGQTFTLTQQGETPSDTALGKNVAVTRTLTAATRQAGWHFYYFTLPAGATNLALTLTGLTADVDLYVKQAAKPTTSSADCASYASGTTAENCTIASPSPGQWWVGVNNWDTGSINYTVKANWSINANDDSLADAVDNPSLAWITKGNSNWLAQTEIKHDGVDAARSGVISHNQYNQLETTITGPTTLSFWWKVSSESGYDFLLLGLDYSAVASISGEQEWVQVSQTIPAGTHTLTWQYAKDGSVSNGSDSGWVDQVTIGTPTAQPSAITVPETDGDGAYPISWGASATGGATYLLEEATNPSFSTALRTAYSGSELTTTITGRNDGTTYYYRVKATKNGFIDSVWQTGGNGCAVGTSSPTAETPGALTIPSTDADGSYPVSWGASATSDVSYLLEEATNASFSSGLRTAYSGPDLTTTISGRAQDVTYYYRVKATRGGYTASAWRTGDNGCLVAAEVTPAGIPFSITVPSTDMDGNYAISWGGSATSGATYILEEATSPSFDAGLRTAYSGLATTALIESRTSNLTYYYRVKASKTGYIDSYWQTGGNGCTIGNASTVGPPSFITIPTSNASRNYNVSWGPSETSGVTYLLQEATNAAFTTGLRTVYTGTARTKAITGGRIGSRYYYRVMATKPEFTNSAWRVGENNCLITTMVTTPASLTYPATDADGAFPVSWGASATSGVTYILEEATNAAFTTNLRTAYSGTAKTTAISGRAPGFYYYYRVKATKTNSADSGWRTKVGGKCLVGSGARP